MSLYKAVVFVCCVSLLAVSCASGEDNGVTMKNVEEFKSKFSDELRVGSPKEKVERYLNQLNLEHSYVESEKKFYAIVRVIGRYRIIYESALLIRIQLNDSEKVERIEYEIEHSGL
jgi:hypothetical protein